MFQNIIIAFLVLAIVLPVGAFFIGERGLKKFKGTLAINVISFFGMMIFATVFLFSGHVSAETASVVSAGGGFKYIGAALASGFATMAAGYATSTAASAALGALSENENIMGKALIFVALAEGIAIYGLIIAIMILNS